MLNGSIINGATGTVYIIKQPGYYSVEITDTNGCITISNPVENSVQYLALVGDVSIYPNPSIANWQLTITEELIGAKLEVFDEQGRLVFKSAISNPKSEINLNAASGVYYLRISNDKVSVVRKLVKM